MVYRTKGRQSIVQGAAVTERTEMQRVQLRVH